MTRQSAPIKSESKMKFFRQSKFVIFLSSFLLLPIAAYLLESLFYFLFENDFLSSVVFAPLLEESGKITLFLFLTTKKDFAQNNFKQNVFLISAIGFLFGAAENLLYLASVLGSEKFFHIVLRIATAQIFHTLIPLTFLLLRKRASFVLAYVVAILSHSLWNSLIYFELNTIFIYLFALLLTLFAIYELLRIKEWHT